MNSGYLGYLVMAIAILLLASGWRNVFIRGIRSYSLLLFFLFWIAFSFADFPFASMRVNGVVIVLLLAVIGSLAGLADGEMRYRAIAAGMLLGLADSILIRLLGETPFLALATPDLYLAILYAILISLRFRPFLMQLAVLTIGLLFGDLLNGMPLAPEFRTWGGPSFWDRWWVALCTARILSTAFSVLWAQIRQRRARYAVALKGRRLR